MLQNQIEPFTEGDWTRTALSAGTMNELVNAINSLLNMEGRGGIRVYKSDNKFVIWGGNLSAASGSTQPIIPTSGSVNNYYTTCLCKYA